MGRGFMAMMCAMAEDERLRIVNLFSFPTKSWKFGFRLGNVEIISERYGIIDPVPGTFLSILRSGHFTLQQLYEQLLTSPSTGAGEEMTGAAAAAIANAVFDAIGVRLRQYPMTPPRVRAALATSKT